MRMRTKKWAKPELAVCPFYIPDPSPRRGRWAEEFAVPQPLWLELGCGKGGFLAQAALAHPDRNFLGVDLSTDVLGVGRRKIQSAYFEAGREIGNLRMTIFDITRIDLFLSPEDQAERIFINFCNPWPKPKQYKKRLTHSRQLAKYRAFLPNGGEIWFKTDDDELFTHSVRYFEESGFRIRYRTEDLHKSGFEPNFRTEHEEMYSAEGIKIKFLIAEKLPDGEKESPSLLTPVS